MGESRFDASIMRTSNMKGIHLTALVCTFCLALEAVFTPAFTGKHKSPAEKVLNSNLHAVCHVNMC